MGDLRRWFFPLRIPLVLLGVALFFGFYNRFLIDRNLQNLKSSLLILDKATGVGQAEAALLLVDQTLVSQMAREELDLKTIATLQYAQGILASDKKLRPVEDTQSMLSVIEEEQDLGRSGYLKSVDAVILGAQAFLNRASLLPRQVLGKATSPEIDQAGLQEAARLEQRGLTADAARAYERLINRYPSYEGRATLHLRLGSLYEWAQNFSGASQQYQEAERLARNSGDLTVARQSYFRLKQLQAKRDRAVNLEKKLSQMSSGLERQQLAANLGALWIELSDMNRAAAAFRQAEGPTALFKEAWCLRAAGRLEEALRAFLDLAKKFPRGSWSTAAYQQIAEIYKASGNYEGAAQSYERALTQGDDALAAVVHAQAGSTYLYDLNKPEKALAHFRDLDVQFPASPFSTTLQQIQEIRREKRLGTVVFPVSATSAGTPLPTPSKSPMEELNVGALTEASPVVGWMEKFLPVFVDVFTNRLAKYLTATNQSRLKRQFTEAEFQQLVVREVQRRFPGEVTNVQARIRPDGFVGSGSVRLGLLAVPVEAQIGITVVKERPHAGLQKITVAKIPLPKTLLQFLENRVNEGIDQAKYPLRVKEYTLKDGFALISVELVR